MYIEEILKFFQVPIDGVNTAIDLGKESSNFRSFEPLPGVKEDLSGWSHKFGIRLEKKLKTGLEKK